MFYRHINPFSLSLCSFIISFETIEIRKGRSVQHPHLEYYSSICLLTSLKFMIFHPPLTQNRSTMDLLDFISERCLSRSTPLYTATSAVRSFHSVQILFNPL